LVRERKKASMPRKGKGVSAEGKEGKLQH